MSSGRRVWHINIFIYSQIENYNNGSRKIKFYICKSTRDNKIETVNIPMVFNVSAWKSLCVCGYSHPTAKPYTTYFTKMLYFKNNKFN